MTLSIWGDSFFGDEPRYAVGEDDGSISIDKSYITRTGAPCIPWGGSANLGRRLRGSGSYGPGEVSTAASAALTCCAVECETAGQTNHFFFFARFYYCTLGVLWVSRSEKTAGKSEGQVCDCSGVISYYVSAKLRNYVRITFR